MPLPEKHIPLKRSAVLKHCCVCDTTKHICAFSHSAYTYCNNVCNVCYLERKSSKKSIFNLTLNKPSELYGKSSSRKSQNTASLVDKLLNGVSSDSETISSEDTFENEVAQYVVPYSKWITVQLFDVNAFPDTIFVGKVVPSSI